MKRYYIDLNKQWAIIFAYDIELLDLDEVANWLEALGASDEDVRRASYTILCWNTGFTFTSGKQKMSVVCISRSSSVEEFMNTLSHELDHVQEAVCKYYDIELGTERAAYVQGDIMAQLVHAVRVNK